MSLNETRGIIENVINNGMTNIVIAWPSVPFKEIVGTPFIRVRVVPLSSSRITIGRGVWRDSGSVLIQCFASMRQPSDQYYGQAGALIIAEQVCALFRDEIASGIRFADISLSDVGDDGAFYQVNVAISYERDGLVNYA